eukprot:3924872-Pleurochrysis_carterae.AAC.1
MNEDVAVVTGAAGGSFAASACFRFLLTDRSHGSSEPCSVRHQLEIRAAPMKRSHRNLKQL